MNRARWLPGLQVLARYERAWLRHDVVAGLTLTAVLVPVGVAYAVASGLPAVCGLYASMFGLLAYAAFGPSRVLVLGPDSSLVALVAGVVLPLSGGDPQRAMALAALMAVVSGALCMAAGAARLGFITELLSKPIRYGYMNGIALAVLATQLPALVFANAEWFKQRVLAAVAAAPPGLTRVVVGAEPITSIDVTASDALGELDEALQAAGILLCLAEMKGPVKDKLKRFGLFASLGESRFFATLGEAVSAHIQAAAVDWVDWEDRR